MKDKSLKFRDMSVMTKAETKSYSNVLDKMSKPTGHNLFEMMEEYK